MQVANVKVYDLVVPSIATVELPLQVQLQLELPRPVLPLRALPSNVAYAADTVCINGASSSCGPRPVAATGTHSTPRHSSHRSSTSCCDCGASQLGVRRGGCGILRRIVAPSIRGRIGGNELWHRTVCHSTWRKLVAICKMPCAKLNCSSNSSNSSLLARNGIIAFSKSLYFHKCPTTFKIIAFPKSLYF